MAKAHWVKVQRTLRTLAARAARNVRQFDKADELDDADMEGILFAHVVDTPNCQLDFDPDNFRNSKITAQDVREATAEAVIDMLEALADEISCERCSEDIIGFGYDAKFLRSKEYRAYAAAVKAYARVFETTDIEN